MAQLDVQYLMLVDFFSQVLAEMTKGILDRMDAIFDYQQS